MNALNRFESFVSNLVEGSMARLFNADLSLVEIARRCARSMQDATMIALGSLAETRDNLTGNHIRRTQNYIRLLAGKLGMTGKYREVLSYDAIERLYKSAPLHDIGKVGIRDAILEINQFRFGEKVLLLGGGEEGDEAFGTRGIEGDILDLEGGFGLLRVEVA